MAPGPARQGYLRRLEILVDQINSYDSRPSLSASALFHVPTPTGEPANNEFLSEAGADAFRRADREISKD